MTAEEIKEIEKSEEIENEMMNLVHDVTFFASYVHNTMSLPTLEEKLDVFRKEWEAHTGLCVPEAARELAEMYFIRR